MSDRERAIRLLNRIDDDKMIFIVRMLESVVELAEVPEIPNEITVAAKRPLGIADGKFKIPDDLDKYNDEIAVMFGVN